jgi:hypothetical protein
MNKNLYRFVYERKRNFKIQILYILHLFSMIKGVDGRIILKWTCERLDGGAWTGSTWLRIGTGGGLL